MAVCDGVSRIDIAVANGNLCGYEIKSDADTSDRLSSQSESYCKTFDKMFIVAGEKYRDAIYEYIPIIEKLAVLSPLFFSRKRFFAMRMASAVSATFSLISSTCPVPALLSGVNVYSIASFFSESK